MTRGILSFVLVAVLTVVVLTGCAKKAVYVDGSYVGHSAADERGSVGYAIITVSGGKITDAKLAGLQVKTTDNYQYATSINAWPTLEQSLITAQDPAKVDAVSQATGNSTLFKKAATATLKLARNK